MKYKVFIISDGTGKTAEGAVKSAIAQFQTDDVQLDIRKGVHTDEEVEKIIKDVKEANGFIVHTIVSKRLRDKILDLGRLNDIGVIDLMGPLLGQLSHWFSYSPLETPGLFRKLNKSYFQRIESMEFAFRHDDGQKIEELKKAEIVLLGVSRTFKTPLSIYLAFKGWRVANVPIILNLEPHEILFDLRDAHIFGLTSYPRYLAELRSVRDEHLGGATGQYADVEYVQQELKYSYKIFRSIKNCSLIEVTNKPIEEIASEILDTIKSGEANND
ncbi:MAG: pyruvate, water dikinase regulatory protein [Acidobacteriota bacterium]